MKKILFSLLALAMGVGANAQNPTRIFSTYDDAQSKIQATVGSIEIEGVTYKTVTFNVTNNDAATAFSLYFIYDKKSLFADCQPVADGPLTTQVKVGLKKVDCYTPTYSSTSNYPAGSTKETSYAFFNANWNVAAASVTPTAIASGDWCTLYIDNSATGTLNVDGITVSGSTGYNLPYLTIDLGGTAINEVNADATTTVSGPAYNLAGQRVNDNAKGLIIKGGKKLMVK